MTGGLTRRKPFIGWVSASTISLTGTRLSMVALPWFVLTTTGSPTRTGAVGFAEMAPYVLAKALGGPIVDRRGARSVSISADIASTVAVGAVPLLHATGLLSLPVLVALVAIAGAVRGPGDGAKAALVPDISEHAGMALERITGIESAAERLASTIGAAVAGLIVSLLGPLTALALDAVSFAAAAALIGFCVPSWRHGADAGTDDEAEQPYRQQLKQGWDFLRHDAVLLSIIAMVATTNLLDQAYTVVLVPVWAHDSGRTAAAVGLVFAVFSATSVVGALLAASFGHRLPRLPTYFVAFVIAGAPRFFVFAFGSPIVAVLIVTVAGGFASGFINPILGAVIYERIPRPMLGRVESLNSSLCWSLIPFGGIVGGALVTLAGLAPALLVIGSAYFAATMLPALLPSWRGIDRPQQAAATATR